MWALVLSVFLTIPAFCQPWVKGGDDFSEIIWADLDCGQQVSGDDSRIGTTLEMKIAAFPGKQGDSNPHQHFSLSVYIRAKSWYFIEGGESLAFKLDNEIVKLSGDGSRKYRKANNGYISELASYKISPEQIRLIASSTKEVRMKVSGGAMSWVGSLSDKAINNFKFASNSIPNSVWTVDQLVNYVDGSQPQFKAGINYFVGTKFLQVLKAEPWSKAQGMLGKFITAIEGQRGSGNELHARLAASIAAKQSHGSSIKVTVSAGPGEPEVEEELILAAPK